jgi:transposase
VPKTSKKSAGPFLPESGSCSHTDSKLCERGHNKVGRHHLRQIGLALLADRFTHLPLFYRVYEGNTHDSKVFRRLIDELFGVMCGFNQTKQRLTVVFDKGMNIVGSGTDRCRDFQPPHG